ncbi:MAG: glycosyltransferase [Actinobacteria bacterium]|nr:glycosyltransferase [Actinomycetota bacterium]
MKNGMTAWWRRRDTYDLLAAVFIVLCIVLVVVNISMYPVYLDIPYHMAVTSGFQEAGGVTTWDFWDYAPSGRPHIYPPLLHVGMSMLQDIGLPVQATATLVCVIMFPLILLSLWWAMRRLFGSRAAFYALLLVGVPYAFFYQTGITIAASLVLALTPLVFLALEEDHKIASMLLLAMCLYTHLVLGHLVALALFIYLLHRREAWKKVITVLVGAYLLYLPWGIVVISNLGSFTASEPGLGSDLALHILLWGLAAAGFVVCYLRKKQYYLLPAYLLSMVPIAFFYSHRFWEGHVFLPLAMLGGVALDRLHAFLSERLSRRISVASYARAAAGVLLGVLLVPVLFVDPVLASTSNRPAPQALQDRASLPAMAEGANPPAGTAETPYLLPGDAGASYQPRDVYPYQRSGDIPPAARQGLPDPYTSPPGLDQPQVLPHADETGLPRRPLQRLRGLSGDSVEMSLQPTTLPVLLGLEEAPRQQPGVEEVFGEENEDLMAAILEYGEPGDVVFAPEGRLGDLIYAMTGLYATQGMFHEVQPEVQPDPLTEADLAVVNVASGAMAAGVVRSGSSTALEEEGWSRVDRVGRYVIFVRDSSLGEGTAEGTSTAEGSAALPLWAAYLLLLAAAVAISADFFMHRPGQGSRGGPPEVSPPQGTCGGSGEKAVLAVIPAHDEEGNVGEVVSEIRRVCPGLDILVVDDGSRDRTGEEALLAGAMVLRLDEKMGVGEAERRGLAFAFGQGYSFAVRLDGDGQHPADSIAKLLAPLCCGRADVALGSRFMAGSRKGYTTSRVRRLGMAYFRALLRSSTSLHFNDPTSGYRAYGRKAMYLLSRAEPLRYPEVTSLRLLTANGMKVCEVAVEMRSRQNGRSSIGTWQAVAMIAGVTLELLRVPRALPRRSEKPVLA